VFASILSWSKIMSDNLQKAGGQDRTRINMNEVWEVRYWTEKFGVTREQLEAAVKAAGPMADKVQAHLGK
jgi:hypothetical protein